MNLMDRLRTEYATRRYDFWLELRGVRASRRRELRRELRGNLTEASADVGSTAALFGIGSPKELAYAATDADPTRPRWSLGAMWASLVFGVVLFALMTTATAFTAGVEASGVTSETVRGFVFPWFGVDFTARVEPDGRGFAVGAGGSYLPVLGLPLLTFLLAAKAWRVFRPKPSSAAAGSTERA